MVGAATVNEGSVYTLTIVSVTDPGEDTLLAYTIDWGDGNFEFVANDTFNFPSVYTHIYSDGIVPPQRLISVTVEDEDGTFEGAGSFTLDVNNVAPTGSFRSSGSRQEGLTGLVYFVNGNDISLVDKNAGFRYAYDFNNDGMFEVGNGIYGGSSTATSCVVPAAYIPDGPGIYTVRGRIVDKDGGYTDYTTAITVTNVAVTNLDVGNDQMTVVGTPITGTWSFSDPVRRRSHPPVGWSRSTGTATP